MQPSDGPDGPGGPAAPGSTNPDDYARAILNILDDFSAERDRLADTQRAILNILEDSIGERGRLDATQKAILNILEDFDEEKRKVAAVNEELQREKQALTERTGELARSNADLEQFAYVASHDLQEPLRMVSSYVQLFEKRYRGQVDAEADKYIRYAVEGAKRMQALIAGLLEYSRVGRGELELGPVELEGALAQALLHLRSTVEESGAQVTHGPLPRVEGEAAQLTQVFQNLLANAVKFRREGVPPRIHVSAERQGREYLVAVQDNGIGIDPQYAERIFVIFQRLHTRTDYPGTGIGLSICKKVIERHGGRIWVESTPGQGSTFLFTLRAA